MLLIIDIVQRRVPAWNVVKESIERRLEKLFRFGANSSPSITTPKETSSKVANVTYLLLSCDKQIHRYVFFALVRGSDL
jgi:hypothetical protein